MHTSKTKNADTIYTSEWTAKNTASFTRIYSNLARTTTRKKFLAALEAAYPNLHKKFLGLRANLYCDKIKISLGQVKIKHCPSCGAVCTLGKDYCSRKCNNQANAGAKSKKAGFKRAYIRAALGKNRSLDPDKPNEHTTSWSKKDIRLFSTIFRLVQANSKSSKPISRRDPNLYPLLKALEPHPRLLRKFIRINAYENYDRLQVGLGYAQIPICPTCCLPSKVGRKFCSNECAAEDTANNERKVLDNERRRKEIRRIRTEYTPKTPTVVWEDRHTALFTEAHAKVCRKHKSTRRGGQFYLLKYLEKRHPKLLARYLGILGSRRILVALGKQLIDFCKTCGKPCEVRHTYCSDACMYSNEDRKEQQLEGMKKTWKDRHGVENMVHIPHVKAATLEKHGVEYYSGSAEFKRKAAKTNLKRYGNELYFKTADFSDKRAPGMLRKYGVEHPMQSRKIFESTQKSKFRLKRYVLGGRQVQVQGYEGLALDYVQSKGIKPKNIRVGHTDNVPSFLYAHPGKNPRRAIYHPDFMVLHKGRKIIVEVKSFYTLLSQDTVFKVNKAKARAVLNSEFAYKLLVMDSKGNSLPLPNNWLELSRLELKKTLLAEGRKIYRTR